MNKKFKKVYYSYISSYIVGFVFSVSIGIIKIAFWTNDDSPVYWEVFGGYLSTVFTVQILMPVRSSWWTPHSISTGPWRSPHLQHLISHVLLVYLPLALRPVPVELLVTFPLAPIQKKQPQSFLFLSFFFKSEFFFFKHSIEKTRTAYQLQLLKGFL